MLGSKYELNTNASVSYFLEMGEEVKRKQMPSKAIAGHKRRNDEYLEAKSCKRFLSTITPQGKDRDLFVCSLCHPWISCLF